jgi:hypothetical protein
MLIALGGSPNDTVMGESIYALAVMAEDIWFLQKYAAITSPAVLADGFSLACDGRNNEVIAVVAQALKAGAAPRAPHCPSAL